MRRLVRVEVRRWEARFDWASVESWAWRLMGIRGGVHERERGEELQNWGKLHLIFEVGFALQWVVLKKMVGRD